MRLLHIFILFLLCSNYATASQIKIVTSTTPIAAIISMILPPEIKIEAIKISDGCPHHHQLKLSDLETVKNADYLIYIDDEFDIFAFRMLKHFNGQAIKLSNMGSINFNCPNDSLNWHFWLDINNIAALQKKLASILIKDHPDLKSKILKQQNKSQLALNALKLKKEAILEKMPPIVLTNDSLEHFFNSPNLKITRFYSQNLSSLKNHYELKNILHNNLQYCVVMEIKQQKELYSRYGNKVVSLNSESWNIEEGCDDYSNLLVKNYNMMLEDLQGCK